MCILLVVLCIKTLFADFIAEVIDLFTKNPTNRRFMEKQQDEIVRNYSLYGSARLHSLEKQNLGKMLVQLEFLNVHFWGHFRRASLAKSLWFAQADHFRNQLPINS